MVHDCKDLLAEDIAVAAHAELKPITQVWESSGHEHDESVLRGTLLAKQGADLRTAQRAGWIPPLPSLHTLLPCFAPPEASHKGAGSDATGNGAGTLSTAGSSGLTAMDTDEGSAELAAAAAAAAAAIASQEEREAAAAAAAAERLKRREERRAEKDRRRLRLLQEKKEAKARSRAEAQRRFTDQHQRWEAAVADKRQQVGDLHSQAAKAGDGIRVAEQKMKELEEKKHEAFIQLKKALDEEQAEKQRRQQLALMEEGEVATSPSGSARGAGAPPAPGAHPAPTFGATPTLSAGAGAPAGMRSPTFGQPQPPFHAMHSFGLPPGRGPPGVPGVPGEGPGPGPGFPAAPGAGPPPGGPGHAGFGSGGFYDRGAGGSGRVVAIPDPWEDSRSRDAWGAGGGSAASTPRGGRDMLPPVVGGGAGTPRSRDVLLPGAPVVGGGTPLAGDRADFSTRRPRDFFQAGPPGGPAAGGGREWDGRRGGFDERRLPQREFPRSSEWEGGASRDGLGGGGGSRDGLPRFGGPGGPGGGRGRLPSFEERERLRRHDRDRGEAGGPGERPHREGPPDRPHFGGASRDAWDHGSRDGFDRLPGFAGGGSRDGFPAGFGRGRGGWGPGGGGMPGGRGGFDAGGRGEGRGAGASGAAGGAAGGEHASRYREPPRGR